MGKVYKKFVMYRKLDAPNSLFVKEGKIKLIL